MKEEYITTRNNILKDLERKLHSFRRFKGEYAYEEDYQKIYNKITKIVAPSPYNN